MKNGWGVVIILGIAVLVVFGVLFSGLLHPVDEASVTGLAPGQSADFLGQTVQFPEPWRKYVPGSRGGTLSLKKLHGGRAGGTLTLEDERRKPEDVQHFVTGWMNATGNPGFRPLSVDEFHDAAVDRAGMRCVALRWPDARRSLQLVCIAGSGRWKLTLAGTDADVPGLDALAQQVPLFERTS